MESYKFALEGVVGIDITSPDVRLKLQEANSRDIEIDFNTPGGFIYPNIQIHNLLRNYQGKITGVVSLAASMGSYILMALEKENIIVEDNAVFMIHNARQGAGGDHNDLRRSADLLERTSDILAEAYSRMSGKPISEIKKMMDAETFLYGQEIVDAGFAGSVKKSGKKYDKEQAIIEARAIFEESLLKTKAITEDDLSEIAALLDPENTFIKINIEIDDTEMEPPEPTTDLLNNFSDESGYNITEEEYNSAENFNPEMPYPNFHACRVREPSEFQKGSFRTLKRGNPGQSKPDGRPLNIIVGKLKGKNTLTVQAYRYPKEEWSVSEAQNHCKSHKGKTFEPASGQKAEGCKDCGQKNSTHTNEKSPAVNAGENKERFKKMNLDEFLNQNPDARAEYDKRIKASAEAVENRIAAVTPYLGNKDYEKAMPMAMQALKGDIEMSSFKGAIAAFDMLRAQNVDAAAETDTKEIGDTKAGDIKQPSAHGDAKKPEDISSAVAEAKSMLGMVV